MEMRQIFSVLPAVFKLIDSGIICGIIRWKLDWVGFEMFSRINRVINGWINDDKMFLISNSWIFI